jgi:hypothetical protein
LIITGGLQLKEHHGATDYTGGIMMQPHDSLSMGERMDDLPAAVDSCEAFSKAPANGVLQNPA